MSTACSRARSSVAGMFAASWKPRWATMRVIPWPRSVMRSCSSAGTPGAMMPPSPSLFARITNTMYSSVTMIISAQNTSDSTP